MKSFSFKPSFSGEGYIWDGKGETFGRLKAFLENFSLGETLSLVEGELYVRTSETNVMPIPRGTAFVHFKMGQDVVQLQVFDPGFVEDAMTVKPFHRDQNDELPESIGETLMGNHLRKRPRVFDCDIEYQGSDDV